jgi:hypothetical protein
MAPEEIVKFIENSIEPRLAEMGESYVVLLENNQYVMIYNGVLTKIAYMLGQTLQDIEHSQEGSSVNQDAVWQAFINGYNDRISPKSRESF